MRPKILHMMNDKRRGMKPKSNRRGDPAIDRCQTPSYALDPLIPYLPKNSVIWEPACGEGLLVRGLRDRGYRVISSDILDGVDFFEKQLNGWDIIVTNPPYSKKYEWAAMCYELNKPFALLIPVESLGAAKLQFWMIERGGSVILLNRRVNFRMPLKGWNGGGAQFPVMWFTYKLISDHTIKFGEIPIVKIPKQQTIKSGKKSK